MKMVWSNANQLGRIVDPNQPFMDRQIYIYILYIYIYQSHGIPTGIGIPVAKNRSHKKATLDQDKEVVTQQITCNSWIAYLKDCTWQQFKKNMIPSSMNVPFSAFKRLYKNIGLKKIKDPHFIKIYSWGIWFPKYTMFCQILMKKSTHTEKWIIHITSKLLFLYIGWLSQIV